MHSFTKWPGFRQFKHKPLVFRVYIIRSGGNNLNLEQLAGVFASFAQLLPGMLLDKEGSYVWVVWLSRAASWQFRKQLTQRLVPAIHELQQGIEVGHGSRFLAILLPLKHCPWI